MTLQEYFDSLTHAERVRVNFIHSAPDTLEREAEHRLQDLWNRLLKQARDGVTFRPAASPSDEAALSAFLATVKKR